MAIVLHHTIIRSRDKHRSAAFFAELLGLEVGDPTGSVRARCGSTTHLTFDFDDRFEFVVGHYAFQVDDAHLRRGRWPDDRRARTSTTAPAPAAGWTGEINSLGGGRGVYVRDPDGHSYELFTAVPTFSSEGLMLDGHSANGSTPEDLDLDPADQVAG